MKLSSALRNLVIVVADAALTGCTLSHEHVLAPSGPVGAAERDLMFAATGLMLIVIVPVFVMTFWFARRYRASNQQARYSPEWSYSARIDILIWLVPTLIILALGYLIWTYTHRLDPYRHIAGEQPPLDVQVVAEDWKWLFIYPRQNIASVNQLVFPSNRPLHLELTSDTVMNAFYVPGLGSQIYAMAGMRTNLNLSVDHGVTLTGRNMQYSGRGFANQTFTVRAVTPGKFAVWVAKAKSAPKTLDRATYEAFAKPSSGLPVIHFSGVAPGLFSQIVAKNAAARPKKAEAGQVH